MFKTKFVNFASFICLFGQTQNNNRETLCAHGSVAFAFLFDFVVSVSNARTETTIS